MSWLSIKNLKKIYDQNTIVNNFSVDLSKGELVSIVGPSGSGKSTILKSILGLVTPESGEIYLGDKDLNRIPAYQRNIGMVYQEYSLFPSMTVRENVAFPLKARNSRNLVRLVQSGFSRNISLDIEHKVCHALELVDLSNHIEKKPHQLSGGEQQRVALARALVFEPDLLCFDEPLGALDKNLRMEMQEKIQNLQRELKMTMLYVTHDQSEAMAISDRIGILQDGHLAQIGRPWEIYYQPNSKFVAQFLGDCNVYTVSAIDRISQYTVAKTVLGTNFFTNMEGLKPGDAIGIRPEQLTLVRDSGAIHSEFAFYGTITTNIFQGSTVKVSVLLESGDNITVTVPANDASSFPNQGMSIVVKYDAGAIFPLSE
uniref:Putative spermidine/putrescine transport system ATP-binding protein/mannopine transport system ATP-binding protein n=1 Tax=Candidatus Kentrum sp. FW TaxID=2126338 RepID=A0A450SEG2_9GAMM|nr:MAG: putative spermidine/putrescine transport system ATP-binding protein/mannopine transport system ATP-binding protein [Candidatus Kentron sp. FW]